MKKFRQLVEELPSKNVVNKIASSWKADQVIFASHTQAKKTNPLQVKFQTNELREKYFAGEIFNINDIVECNDQVYKIVKRGSNHLLLQTEEGNLVSKWPQDLAVTEKEFKEKECQMDCNCTKCAKSIDRTPAASNDQQRKMKTKYHLGENINDILMLADIEIDEMIESLSEEDFINIYEDEELAFVDEETNEFVAELQEETINEVLSRTERIRAKVRFARSEAKRERKIKIALKTHSSSSTINKRARKMAIDVLKKRIAKRPLEKLSVSEKERLEKIISNNKNVINRIAMKMVPKVKQIETQRLSHKGYTKENK